MIFYRVAVDAPIFEALTYGPPVESSTTILEPGTPVEVPLGRRARVPGVVLDRAAEPGPHKIKPINGATPDLPLLPGDYLQWLSWLADYYRYPLGQVLQLCYPPLAKKTSPRRNRRAAVVAQVQPDSPKQLNAEQIRVRDDIARELSAFAVHLLHGVTGSGKTEVYLQLMHEVLERGQRVLVLVPEISLTPQLIQRFAARFPGRIAAMHSGLTDRERTEQWWMVQQGERDILVGARSALFCPIPDLGLIVLDEEHEPSFKQDEKLRYHARDAAIYLSRIKNIPIVLGSATPSLESYANAKSGKYRWHQMRQRVMNRPLPQVEVVDLRAARDKLKADFERKDRPFWLSETLHRAMQETLAGGEQVALFLNRRGVAQSVFCQGCGHAFQCPNCEISLTLHGRSNLVCHYCDYHQVLGPSCPQCQSLDVKPVGLGTEQIESDVGKLFPQARIARADRDEITTRAQLEHLIESVESRRVDILVGTQMIAKGLDFPGLTLVGLVLADVGFNLPDFRSAERAFQLITQMSGRSGRHSASGGRVIVQTFATDNPALRFALTADYLGFADHEIAQRAPLLYPPLGRLACLRVTGPDRHAVETTCQALAHRAATLRTQQAPYREIQILGPAQAPLARLRGRYRYHVLVKSQEGRVIQAFLRQLMSDLGWVQPRTKVQVDIDPINMM